MLRIRGTVGDWPVDLSIEMDEGDWAQLGAQLQVAKSEGVAAPAAKPVNPDDAQWQIARNCCARPGN